MTRRNPLAAAVSVLVLAALAGCGGDASSAEPGTADGLTPVTFASLSVSQVAPLVLAEQQGVFEEHGLDVTFEYMEPAAVVPALMSGQADIGWLNAPAVLVARSNGLPLQSVLTMSTVPEDPATFPIQLMVPVDSPITSADQLPGHTVAVDSLYQLPDLGLRGAFAAEGIDTAEITYVEIPFPEMAQALELGRVDAANTSDPFGTIISEQGIGRDLLSTSVGQEVGSPQSVLISTEAFIGSDPDTVTAFQDAAREATEYATTHEQEVRDTLLVYTQIAPELTARVRFAKFSNEGTAEGWQAWADLLTDSGVTTETVTAADAYISQ